MKNRSLIFMLVLLSGSGPEAISQIQVKQSHPRILLDSSIILKLQGRATNNTTEWQQLVTRIGAVSGYNSQSIMNNVYEGQQYAFMYALSFYANGSTAHRDSAVSIFKEYFNHYTKDSSMYYDSGYESRSTMVEIAMLYDWLYNYLPTTFRTTVRTRLIHWANWILTKPNIYGIWTGPYYYEGNNYTMGHFAGITSVGFAIHSEDPANGNKFIAKVDSIRPFLMNYANTRLKHGDANEGWGYGAGYAVNYLKALAIFKTGTNYTTDHFLNTTYDEDVVKFLPFASLPNLTHMLPEGDWARESSGELWEYHRLVADLVSSYSDNSQAKQVGLFWANETVPFNKFAVTAFRWFPFLFSNKEITALDYRTLPAYQSNYIYTDTSGTDQFIRRTGWNATSQWISYRAGGRYGDHAHNGSGHFSVYDQGWLLIDKNIQTSSGIEGSDSLHNCIHIEKMNTLEMYPFKDPIEHSTGIRRDLNQEYSYLWTNSTPIYEARGQVTFNCVTKNQRQFFYIPGLGKIAIFDMVKTSSNYKKWFGLNYYGTASLSNDSSYSFYSNAQKTAYVHTCYPLAKSASVFNNSVRVGNKTGQQNNYFMHLVNITPAGAPALNVISVNRHNGRVIQSDFYGSFHEDQLKNYCILFAGDDPAFNHDSLIYEVPTTSNLLHSYIAGLNPGTTYYTSHTFPATGIIRIKVSVQDHGGATSHVSTAGGILSFDTSDPLGLDKLKKDLLSYHAFYNKEEQSIVIESLSVGNEHPFIAIYDACGKLVLSKACVAEKYILFSTENLSPGIYIVTVTEATKNYRKKISVY